MFAPCGTALLLRRRTVLGRAWLPQLIGVPLSSSPINAGLLSPVTPVRRSSRQRWTSAVAGTPPLTALGSVVKPITSPRRRPPGCFAIIPGVRSDTLLLPLRGLVVSSPCRRNPGRASTPSALPPQPFFATPLRGLMVAGGHVVRAGKAEVQLSPGPVPPQASVLQAIKVVRTGGGWRDPSRARRGGRGGIVPSPATLHPTPPNFTPLSPVRPLVRGGDSVARKRAGWLLRWHAILTPPNGPVWYHVYENTGLGDPINYASPLATVTGLTWTSGALSYPGTWQFGVRAFWRGSGLEEQDLEAAVTIILDANGHDITSRPVAPMGLRAFATVGGAVRV
ncbi:MAG TPA: hypothetical protein VKA15_13680, partial [Isosphaeraceae bacterium]|nr:hypothetical protein [Isosphaeraceae bacterium]